jgi:hypothetical protein
MEARTLRAALLAAVLLVSMGAQRRTPNFIIETADPAFAEQVAKAAEQYRRDLAVEWLGKAMPKWSQPCVITVQDGPRLDAGGVTRFEFASGEVFNWRMSIQGSRERILDSVLPHEITHMIYASHFRQPLPRWADEGGATSVEHVSERNKHRRMLDQFLRTGRGLSFSQMFAMTEYPADIMPLYAEGYSLAEFLIQSGGRRKYVEFLGEGLETDDWAGAVARHYGSKDLGALQGTWLAWVRSGSPILPPRATSGPMLASAQSRNRPAPNLIYHIRESVAAVATTIASNEEPTATMVPVHFPKSAATAVAGVSPRPTDLRGATEEGAGARVPAAAVSSPRVAASGELKWLDASSAAGATALAAAARAPSVDPFSTQAAHPQPIGQP